MLVVIVIIYGLVFVVLELDFVVISVVLENSFCCNGLSVIILLMVFCVLVCVMVIGFMMWLGLIVCLGKVLMCLLVCDVCCLVWF